MKILARIIAHYHAKWLGILYASTQATAYTDEWLNVYSSTYSHFYKTLTRNLLEGDHDGSKKN